MNLSGRKVNLQIVKVGGAIEELESCRYDLTLIDKANTAITISVLGIDRISTDITPIEVSGVIKLLEGVSAQDLDRPEEGEIEASALQSVVRAGGQCHPGGKGMTLKARKNANTK